MSSVRQGNRGAGRPMRYFARVMYGMGIAFLVVSVIKPEALTNSNSVWWAILFITVGAFGWKDVDR